MGRVDGRRVVYLPDKAVKQGLPAFFRDMLREAIDSRYLTLQLFKRNFAATYQQSVLGVLWVLIIPLVGVVTFIFLNSGGIFNMGDLTIPYPLFAVAGMVAWQLFSVGLILSGNSLVSAGAMITKINFPRESLVVSSVAQGIVPALVQILPLLALFGWYRIMPPVAALLVPFALVPLLLLTVGLGLILSLINGILRDVGNSLSVLVTFLMFLTPVLYARPDTGIVAAVSQYNPLYYLIAVPRDLLLTGRTAELAGYLYSSLFAVVLFLVCWMAFHLAETKIPERI